MCSAACSSSLKVNLELTLPTDIKVSDIKWLSVWCRKFKLNMGDLVADFMLANAEEGAAEAEAETVEAEAETVEAEAETVEAEAEAEVEEDDHHSGYFENPSISSVTRGNLVGNFKTYQHGAAGRVFAVDEQTLRIEGFEYDGKGPDAYFIAGIKGSKPGSPGSRYLNILTTFMIRPCNSSVSEPASYRTSLMDCSTTLMTIQPRNLQTATKA